MSQRVLLSAVLVGVLVAGGCKSMSSEKEGDEKDEVKVRFADVPAAVQTTLTREANGQSVASVDREMHHGKTIYEADVMMGGKNWEIKVAEDGSLLSKKLDDEDEENGEKKGEKEDDDVKK